MLQQTIFNERLISDFANLFLRLILVFLHVLIEKVLSLSYVVLRLYDLLKVQVLLRASRVESEQTAVRVP